jgi:hypothetical protein
VLLPDVTRILSTYPHDPTILCDLAIKLARPVPFTQVLTLASEEALIQALSSNADAANLLALSLVEKAAKSPNDTAILSIMKSLVEQIIRTWLSNPNVGVGEKATKILGDLLEVDCDRRTMDAKMNGMSVSINTPPGQGLLWRRIFHDRDIYEMIFALCKAGTHSKLDPKQISLAQARLLRLLPRLSALDFQTVSRIDFLDIEKRYGMDEGQHGLLYFAAVKMVDKEDMLMHITLIDFFAELLEELSTTELTSTAMTYLASLFKRAIDEDHTLYKSLEAIAVSHESTPEVVELLVNLERDQHQ